MNRIEIPLQIGDQSASMWGSCCFNRGDVKVTLGTGSFLNVNTGQKCHASVHGLYPLVAWKWRNKEQKSDELMYCVEVSLIYLSRPRARAHISPS